MCVPRANMAGHYTCDSSTGGKLCLEGWSGDNCDISAAQFKYKEIYYRLSIFVRSRLG